MSGSTRSSDNLHEWLTGNGFAHLCALFDQNDIDFSVLPSLTYQHLQELEIPLGTRIKLLRAIESLGAPPRRRPDDNGAGAAGREQTRAERRQMTVMFCDIVASTRLASRLDPERLSRVLNEYRRLVSAHAARAGAYVAQFLGDGALLYFGFPKSAEDDAERALRAALALLADVASADRTGGVALQLRIGVATGTVVVDELYDDAYGGERSAVGKTPHLAAKLQALAAPGSVYIDRTTRKLVGGLFAVRRLDAAAIDGFTGRVPLYRVVGEKTSQTRFEAQRSRPGSVVGRDHELALIAERWADAQRGNGQMVLIRGEAGIGKSRLLWEVGERTDREGYCGDRLQCVAHRQDTAFFPLLERIARHPTLAAAPAPDAYLDALAALLAARGVTDAADVRALASLLGRDTGAAADDDPEARRSRALALLGRYLIGPPGRRPRLVLFEDLHWCDPTTLELLDRVLQQAAAAPLLIVATARPEFHYPFPECSDVTQLHLERLNRGAVGALLSRLCGGAAVPDEVLDVIAARTDGVPLFVEELSKSLLESGYLRQTASGVAFDAGRDADAIPDSLQNSLMARLDNLGPLKRTAQIAACIGRTFRYRTLAAAVDDERSLGRALDGLLAAELIYGRGEPPDAQYSFKHALVRDVAYDSLLGAERRAVHGRIAATLDADGATFGESGPELLAYHLSHAGAASEAITQWRRAAVVAKQRSANNEAVAHLQKALALLPQLPDDARRAERELTLLLELIAPYRAVKGFAAVEVAEVTRRALALSDRARDTRGVLPLLYNQWVYHFVTGDRGRCAELAGGILARARHADGPALRMTGLRALGATLFTEGRLADAVRRFEDSIALYADNAQGDVTQLVGLDSYVVAHGYMSLAEWCLGKTRRARQSSLRAQRKAEALAHASTSAFAVYHGALLTGLLQRDHRALQQKGAALAAIGDEHRFEMWLVCGQLLGSLGRALQHRTRDHLATAERHLISFADMGVVYRPAYSTLLAELCCSHGDCERGLRHIDDATTLMASSGERWAECDTLRVKAELLTLAGEAAQALDCFDAALDVARRQGARQLAARALRSLRRCAAARRRSDIVSR